MNRVSKWFWRQLTKLAVIPRPHEVWADEEERLVDTNKTIPTINHLRSKCHDAIVHVEKDSHYIDSNHVSMWYACDECGQPCATVAK